jgi:hypothetical protein
LTIASLEITRELTVSGVILKLIVPLEVVSEFGVLWEVTQNCVTGSYF